MKTREQIYGQEAAGLLRDVSMYRALTEMQLLKLYPHKESKEQLINQMLSAVKEVPPKYIVLIEQPEQIAEIHTPNTSGYCTVSSGGDVQYYQIE